VVDFPARLQRSLLVKTMVLWGLGLVTLSGGLLASLSASFAPNPQSWVEVRTTHFVVVSNANERDARRVAQQFEMVRTVFQENLGHALVLYLRTMAAVAVAKEAPSCRQSFATIPIPSTTSK